MTFEYCEIINGNDYHGKCAPYQAQIPIYIVYKVTTTATTVRFLRWTVYWYESIPSGTQRKNRTETITYATGTQSITSSAYVPEPYIDIQKVTYSSTKPKLVVELLNSVDTVLEKDEFEFEIYGQSGAVNWEYELPSPYDDSPYPIIGEGSNLTTFMTDYVSTSSGTPLVWREAYEKFGRGDWGKLMIIRGTGTALDLDVAQERGYIPDTWDIHSYVNHSDDFLLPFWYIAILYLRGGFLDEGDYKVILAYYEKNGSEFAGDYTLRMIESPQFRIYNPFAGADMHISSIIPAEYKEGDSDPNNGMPPFVVTVADDTVRNEFTVPLSSITIEWGDPDSGVNNAWSILEPGTSQITIPPHSYNGYGPYNILMTCVDKRGGTTTKSIQFAPSKVPRIMKSPTLNGTPSGGVISLSYPALMQGEAFNAGLPTPTTTWEYTFQSDPGYYSGERTGDYVEFSLLAEGTYSVTATIENSGITIGAYSWTVNVGAEPVSTSNDKQMPDYALIVLDASGQPLDRCKQHTCPNYSENFQGLDTVSFELPADYQYADHLKEGDYFLFGMRGARLMQVAYRSQKNNILTITGECVFPVRVAIYATRSTASDGYDVQTCSAEALIRYFVHTALSDPYNSQPRSADFWMHGTNQDLPTNGAQVTYSARYDNILDIVNSVCKTSGIGYSIAVRDVADSLTSVQMTVREGTNRTYATGGAGAVIFSEKLKNCIINSDQSAVSSNVAIGAGEGVGYIREYSYYDKDGNQNPTTTGFNRRELFVDAGDSADTSEQKRISVYQLREEQALSISLQVLPACQWKFGTDYRVGDTVSVWLESRGGLVDLQIYSADCVLRESGEELHLHLGSRVQTAPALIASNERKNTYARK